MIPSGGRQETDMGKREGKYFKLPAWKEKSLKQPVQKWADRMGLVRDSLGTGLKVFNYI